MKKYFLDELLIATGNQGKYREFQEFLKGFKLRSLSGFDISEPDETEDNFTDNALLKVRYYYEKTNLPSISDDSGLCIPALGGMPGVYSARWAGPNKDFKIAMEKVYALLKEKNLVPESDIIPAYFMCVIALKIDDKDEFSFVGRVDGRIRFPISGKQGFGYDPIFCPLDSELKFSEMSPKSKAKLSHRNQAVAKLLDFFNKNVAF